MIGLRRLVAVVLGVAVLGALSFTDLASAQPGSADLARLLPRAGELSDFKPSGSLQVFKSVTQDVANDPPGLSRSDAANLRRDGFVLELARYWAGSGASKTFAASGVTRLRSHAAAESYAKFTLTVAATPGAVNGPASQVRFQRFAVPGVPGATGVAEIDRHRAIAHANLQWVEGDCVLQVGDGVPSHTALTSPLVHAAESIYSRTKGSCVS